MSAHKEAAKAAILAESDNLAKAGVTFVAVHFDGYGDDGATEEVKCSIAINYVYAIAFAILIGIGQVVAYSRAGYGRQWTTLPLVVRASRHASFGGR